MVAENGAVLRKMVASREQDAGEEARPADAVWANALPVAAQASCGMPIRVADVQCDTAVAADVAADIGDMALLCLIEGPGGAAGLMVFDARFLSAFVSFRMTGTASDAVAQRGPTRVDAKLASGLVTAIMRSFGAQYGAENGGEVYAQMHYGGFLADARLAQFALPDGPLLRSKIDAALGHEAVAGQVQIILPPFAAAPAAPPENRRSPESWATALADNVHDAPMALSATLARFDVPLSQLLSLSVGQKLTLPGRCMDKVRLQTADGRVIATGRLGRAAGDRAVRVASGTPPVAPDLSQAPMPVTAPPQTGETVPRAPVP